MRRNWRSWYKQTWDSLEMCLTKRCKRWVKDDTKVANTGRGMDGITKQAKTGQGNLAHFARGTQPGELRLILIEAQPA